MRAGADPTPELPGPLRVLVADDNQDAADSLAALVRLWGHEARIAYDGATALALVTSDPPEVVLADLAMPTLDGRGLAQRLRAVPGGDYFILVAVTGYAESSHRDQAIAAGFDHYLVKPVEPDDLKALLRAIRERAFATIARAGEQLKRADDLVRAGRALAIDAKVHVHQLRSKSDGPSA